MIKQSKLAEVIDISDYLPQVKQELMCVSCGHGFIGVHAKFPKKEWFTCPKCSKATCKATSFAVDFPHPRGMSIYRYIDTLAQ